MQRVTVVQHHLTQSLQGVIHQRHRGMRRERQGVADRLHLTRQGTVDHRESVTAPPVAFTATRLENVTGEPDAVYSAASDVAG